MFARGKKSDDIREEVVNKAESTFDLVRDHEEFYEKDTTTKKFGIGGFFGYYLVADSLRPKQWLQKIVKCQTVFM